MPGLAGPLGFAQRERTAPQLGPAELGWPEQPSLWAACARAFAPKSQATDRTAALDCQYHKPSYRIDSPHSYTPMTNLKDPKQIS